MKGEARAVWVGDWVMWEDLHLRVSQLRASRGKQVRKGHLPGVLGIMQPFQRSQPEGTGMSVA